MNNFSKKYVLASDIPKDVEEIVNNECSKRITENLETVMKTLYDNLYHKNSLTGIKSDSFRKLLTDGFDSEQIFQQIELQNKSAIMHFSKKLEEIKYPVYLTSNTNDEVHDSSDNDSEDNVIQNSDDDDQLNFSHNKKDEYIFDDDDDSMSSVDMDYDKKDITSPKKDQFHVQKSKYKSIVDDQFFKLSNLEEFLKREDLRAENKLEEPEDEEDIDYFQDIPTDDDLTESDEECEEETAVKKSSREIMYDDFFDAPESGDEHDDMNENMASANEVDELNNEDEESVIDDYDTETEQNQSETQKKMHTNDLEKETSKTPFEMQQEKIKETISNYEDLVLKKPEWHLTGEVAATSRPKDSLLHKETDFDMNAKPVIVEDAKLEEQTENAIKTIIKNKAFSDGQRMIKAVNNSTLKKEIFLDQNKSKKSLAEVYEDEYLKKKYGAEEEENPKHVEIKKMMDSLLPELHALFCHIPKPAIPDIKIVSNLPAIAVEEVAPTSTSDVTMLAPEEVKRKTGLIKGHTERTDTDRKRERKKKKMMQRMKFKKLQNGDSNENSNVVKSGKQAKIEELKKIKQHRNTKLASMDTEKIKSSKDFFSRLQETVGLKDKPIHHNKKKK